MRSNRIKGYVRNGVAALAAAALAFPPGTGVAEESGAGSAVQGVSFSAEQLLTYAGNTAEAGEEEASEPGSADENATSASDEAPLSSDDAVTIVVQLEEGSSAEPPGVLSFLSIETSARDRVKRAIVDVASDADAQVAVPRPSPRLSDGILLMQDRAGEEDGLVEYRHAIEGFTIKAPRSLLSSIRSIEGVKNAFVERTYRVAAERPDADSSGFAAVEAFGQQPEGDLGQSVNNRSALKMSGADKVDEKGDGMLIAVIDTGVETAHPAFRGDLDDSRLKCTEKTVRDVRSSMVSGGRNATYVSEKIPFAYDYADRDANATPTSSNLDHGTHVAGIAAANAGEVRGTAPHAQIAAMKVASDTDDSISDSAVLAALDDAAALDPDVVNMSLGSNGGFSAAASSTYSDAFSALRAKGAVLSVSEGNSYSSAAQDSNGTGLPALANPDSGIASNPSTLASAYSVAAANNAIGKSYVTLADGSVVPFVQGETILGATGRRFDAVVSGTCEFIDCANAYPGDLKAVRDTFGTSLAGRIALVRDGDLDEAGSKFKTSARVKAVAALDPAAIIMVAKEGEARSLTVGLDATMPVICVGQADGRKMSDAAVKTVTVQKGKTLDPPATYSVTDFSSWGPTPDLSLKPEILAPGGNIYSSIPGGRYGVKSGTSMSAPYVAGLMAVLRQHIEASGRYAGMDERARSALAMQLMMSTAVPVPYGSDSYYSPRQQGSGMVDIAAAEKSDVYLAVESSDDQRPKADLGESAEGVWSFKVVLHNVGTEPRTYAPDTAALSDQIKDGNFAQVPVNYAGRGIDVSYGGDYRASDKTITVQGRSTATLEVRIACGQAFKEAVAPAVNGTFVDGFTFLKPTGDAPSLSVPFLGFYGTWSKPPVFDAKAGDRSASAAMLATRLMSGPTSYPLGVNPLDERAQAKAKKGDYSLIDLDRVVVSSQNIVGDKTVPASPNALCPSTGLLRGVDQLVYDYVDAGGKTVKSTTLRYVPKSSFSSAHGRATSAEEEMGEIPSFNGTDSDGKRLADGTYRLVQTATTSGPHPAQQVQEFSFSYDTTPPVISDYKVEGEGDAAIVTFKATDATYLAGIDFHDPATGKYFYRKLADDSQIESQKDGVRTYAFSIPVADLKREWKSAGLGADRFPAAVPLFAWDYGLNHSEQVNASQTPGAADADGFVIDGKTGALTAYVGSSTVVSIPSTVTSIGAGAFQGSAVQSVVIPASVESIGDNAFSGCASLASVRFEDSPQEPAKLSSIGSRAFAGTGSFELKLPSKVSSVGAEAFAESGIERAVLPASLAEVPERAFAGSKIKQVDIAEGVRAIGAEAFSGCDRLKTVVHGSEKGLPASVAEISPRAFRNAGLSELELGGVVRIGAEAFSGSSISKLVIPDSVTDLGSGAVSGMPKLREVRVGANVAADGLVGAFSGDTALTRIDASAGSAQTASDDGVLFSADKKRLIAFPEGRVGSYQVPDGVESVGNRAFESASITSAAFPESLRAIGDSAFLGSRVAGKIALGKDFESIGASAFARTSIEGADIGGAERIGDSAFADCPQLASVDLRGDLGRLSSIGASAFAPNSALTSVDLPDSVVSVGEGAFADNDRLTSVRLGASMTGSFADAFKGSDRIEKIAVSDANPAYSVEGNVLYRMLDDGLHLIFSPSPNGFSEYAVKEGTVRIDKGAFKNNAALTSVKLPEGLKEIEAGAFNGCRALARVDFPDSLERVNGIPNSLIEVAEFGSNIVEIKRTAFSGHNPAHLIVRGGKNGTYASSSESGPDKQPLKSVYLGEGMVKADFGIYDVAPPAVLVVPSTLSELSLRNAGEFPGARGPVIYAPKNSVGWNAAVSALRDAGYDVSDAEVLSAHLKAYKPLEGRFAFNASPQPGSTVSVTAKGRFGAGESYEYRFTEIAADGSVAKQGSWSSSATYGWEVPAQGGSIRCEVRDAALVSVTATEGALDDFDPIVPDQTAWERLAGIDAMETMKAVVENGWSGQTGGTVVVATSGGYWDALTAAGIAGASGAPVVMTDGASLSSQASDLIKMLKPSKIYIAGGTAAVSDEVEGQIASIANVRPRRLAGDTATDTACKVFEEARSVGAVAGDRAIVATNGGYWDALAATPYAYARHIPIFLTEGAFDISDETLSAMREGGIRSVYVAGGTAAIDERVCDRIRSAGISVEKRFAGATAVETSLLVAKHALSEGMTADRMGVATTGGYWDALAGAALCGKNNAVLALVNDAEAGSVGSFVRERAADIRRAYVFGGSAAVSEDAFGRVSSASAG